MTEPIENPVAHLTEYELHHLAEHLEVSGQADELHRLLALETSDQRNAWYEAKEKAQDSDGYLRDVQCAWRLANGQCIVQRLQGAIGLQCRYAFIVTSINSLNRSISPGLVVELVAGGVWTPEQGLTYAARQAPDSAQRPQVLRALSFYLPVPLLREALTLAQEVEYRYSQAQRIAQESLQLAELGNAEEALNEIQKIENPDHRGRALAGLATSLPESLLPTALAAVGNIEDVFHRYHALKALVIRIAALGHPEQALAEAKNRGSDADKMSSLRALASHLPPSLKEQALQEASYAASRVGEVPYNPTPEVANAKARAEALEALAVRLAQLGHAELALAEAQKVIGATNWAKALDAMAPLRFRSLVDPSSCRPPEELRAALVQSQLIGDVDDRTKALVRLAAAHLPDTFVQTCASQIQTIKDTQLRDRAAIGLARRLAEMGQVQAALTLVLDIKDNTLRTFALDGIAQPLFETVGPQLVLTMVKRLDEFDRAQLLLSLQPLMPKEMGDQVLTETRIAAQGIKLKWMQDEVLARLAPQMAASGRPEQALKILEELEKDYHKADTLAAIAPYLPETMLGTAMAIALKLREYRKQVAVTNLAARLSLSQLRESVTAVLETKNFQNNENLVLLAPYLDKDLIQTALDQLQELRDPGKKGVAILVALLARLAELGYPNQALAQFREYEDGRFLVGMFGGRTWDATQIRAEMLTRIAPSLSGSSRDIVLQEALEAAHQIPIESYREKALVALIPLLKGAQQLEVMREALMTIKAMGGRSREIALVKLLPQLSESLLRDMLVKAHQSGGWDYSLQALVECVTELPKSIQGEVIQTALTAILLNKANLNYLVNLATDLAALSPAILEPLWHDILSRGVSDPRQRMLTTVGALSPILVTLGGEEAVTETFRAIQDVGRWWP